MGSAWPINSIIKRNLYFIITHQHAKFHQNRSRTFWDNRYKDSHTDRHTDRHIHADENNTCPKTKVSGQVIKQVWWRWNRFQCIFLNISALENNLVKCLKVSAYQPHLCTNKTVVTLVWLQQRSMQRFWLQLKKKSEIVRTNWKPIQSVNDNGVNIYFPNNSTNQTVLKRCNLCQFTTITIHTNHPLQFCSK